MEKDTSEIAKLTERIAKDPRSKLFVPLAEEYKKMGNIEMAIQVLRDGLKSNPGYVTARSFLGRLLMEQGDLAGAQKDLEEVIKAIPDNLLAQRKLGDLYVLLGRASDAVQRYKTALALNPGDKEIMSLLADLEAGKDVSSRIPRPKSLPVAPAAKPQPAAAVPLTPKAAPSRAVPAPSAPPSPAATAMAPSAPPPPTATAKAPSASPSTPKAVPEVTAPIQPAALAQPAQDEIEVIEEIVELEPLEQPDVSALDARTTSPMQTEPQPTLSFEEGPSPNDTTFDLNEPVVEQTAGAEGPLAGPWPEDAPVPPSESREGAAEEGSDDLNTNTLAELYISQGFYDKAIEVYQGMLAERPDNVALQQKLDHLRTLAGAPDTSAAQYTAVHDGPVEYIPPTTDIFAEAEAASPESQPVIPQQPKPTAPVEPKAAQLPPRKETPEPSSDAAAPRGPQTATVRRQETIDRLESWLKNIMKEKQE